MDIIFEVTLRRVARDGTTLLFPEVSVETFWTNLYEPPETVIALYHDHGTSEQFHSELKSDMNVERLPSGKFAVNAMILQVALVAFNILRFLGQSALGMEELPYKTEVTRKRLRKVIDELIRIAVYDIAGGAGPVAWAIAGAAAVVLVDGCTKSNTGRSTSEWVAYGFDTVKKSSNRAPK